MVYRRQNFVRFGRAFRTQFHSHTRQLDSCIPAQIGSNIVSAPGLLGQVVRQMATGATGSIKQAQISAPLDEVGGLAPSASRTALRRPYGSRKPSTFQPGKLSGTSIAPGHAIRFPESSKLETTRIQTAQNAARR